MNEASNPFQAMYDRAAYKQPPAKKSVGLAVLLALLFGPLGMFYSSAVGAWLVFMANLLLWAAGVAKIYLITAPVCVLWAVMAASAHNERAQLAREGGAAC